MKESLVNRCVEIRLAEPWEACQAGQWPVLGAVLRETPISGPARTVDRPLLIEVCTPIKDSIGKSFVVIVAYPRYSEEQFGVGHEMAVNFAGLPNLPNADAPVDSKTWKGIGHGTLLLR